MATKKVKVEITKPEIDFTNSVEKIKATAKTVNTEVLETATEVLEDLKNNTANIREAATATINEVIEKATVENSVKFVKNTAEKINDYSVETAEEIIDEVVKGGKAWQSFMEKALKNGFQFYADQQELVFDTLESLKGQYQKGGIKLPNFFNFSFNSTAEAAAPKAATKAKKTAKKVTKKATAGAKAAKETVRKVAKISVTTEVPTKKTATKKATVKATATTTKAAKATAKTTTAKKTTTKKVAAKVTTTVKDNLKAIEGIGPKIEGLLNAAGIVTFQNLADAKVVTLKEILAGAGPRYKMHDPTTWTKQAALAAAGKKDELAKLQDELKGGRVK